MPDPFTLGAPADSSREAQAPAAAQAGPEVHFTPQEAAPEAQDKERQKDSLQPLMELRGVSVFYGDFEAVRDTDLPIGQNRITAMIGPSGCGKSTILRTLNRMNDLIPGARVSGTVTFHGQDIYAAGVDPIQVRRRIGMVFQKPNPFPKSIYDNIAFGLLIKLIKCWVD
jgi:phosphate transport system ATP-binding protein